jgi:hypothetical protein
MLELVWNNLLKFTGPEGRIAVALQAAGRINET